MGEFQRAERVEEFKNKQNYYDVRQWIAENKNYSGVYNLILCIGVNTGLRIGDILRLTHGQIEKGIFVIEEQKTRKERQVIVNSKVREQWEQYKNNFKRQGQKGNTYIKIVTIFSPAEATIYGNAWNGKPPTPQHVHSVIKAATVAINLEGNYGTHSMRKTYAVNVYKFFITRNVAQREAVERVRLLMNHASTINTLLYLGLEGLSADADIGETADIYSDIQVTEGIAW